MKKLLFLITIFALLIAPACVQAESIFITNNSGGAVNSGTLVIIDVSADGSFTTTTTPYAEGMFGVVPYYRGGGVRSIANGARGPIQITGITPIICDQAMTRGMYVSSSSVAGQGTGDTDKPERYIGRVTTADASSPYIPSVYLQPEEQAAGVFSTLVLNYTAPSTTFATFGVIDVNLNVDDLAATSMVHVLHVTAVGSTSGAVEAVGTYSGVTVIHQHIGTFQTPDQATPDAYAGEIPDGGAWSDGLDGKTIFEDDDDEIYIGDVAKFSELEVILSTPSSQNQTIVVEYQHTDTTWDAFVPIDGTNGFQQDGLIIWDSADLTNWKSDSDPGGGDTAAGYYIRIRRTRNNIVTDPIVTTIKYLQPTIHYWDATGGIYTFSLELINFLVIPASDTPPTVDAAGELAMDTNAGGAGTLDQGVLIAFDGVQKLYFPGIDAEPVTDGHVQMYDAGNDEMIWGPPGITIASTFPGGPTAGTLFYHTTPDILFQYEGTWKPLFGYAATLNLYVNETSGSDAIGKGFASGADATATIQYCIDNCIPATSYGNVIIHSTAEVYSEDAIFQGKTIVGNYTITLLGTFSEQLAESTVDSGVQGTGATQGNIVDAGPAWPLGAYDGMWVVFEDDTTTVALRGTIELIDRTTDVGDIFTIVGTFDAQPVAGDTYTIQTPGTVIDTFSIGAGQKSVSLERIHVLLDTTVKNAVATHASVNMLYCKISHATGSTFKIDVYSKFYASRCYWEKVRIFITSSDFSSVNDKHQQGNSLACIYGVDGTRVTIGSGTVIDAADAAREGVYLTAHCRLGTFATAALGYMRIRNCGNRGIWITYGSGTESTGNIQWGAGGDANGTDKTVDANASWDKT